MAWGLTANGFVRQTKEEIKSDVIADMKASFGNDIDLSTQSPFGQFVQIYVKWINDIQEKVEDVYYGQYLNTAEGSALDMLCAVGGVYRQSNLSAVVTLTFTGTNGTTINNGMIVSTSDNITFVTIASGTIAGGQVEIIAQAINSGISGNVPSNSITTINTPQAGVDTVTNDSPASGGRDIESDTELRERYRNRGIASQSSVQNIQLQLNNISGVLSAVVYENATDLLDVNLLNPHSIECIVLGGSSTDIFNVLINYKPAGIESMGNTSVSGVDNKNITRTFKFTRPTEVDCWCIVNITKNNDYPTLGSPDDLALREKVKLNIIKMIGGNYLTDSYNAYINGSVYNWQLISAQYGIVDANTERIPGIATIQILIGNVDPPVTSELNLTIREFAIIDETRITVNVS